VVEQDKIISGCDGYIAKFQRAPNNWPTSPETSGSDLER